MVSHSTSKKLSMASKKNHIRGLKLEKTKEVLKSHTNAMWKSAIYCCICKTRRQKEIKIGERMSGGKVNQSTKCSKVSYLTNEHSLPVQW